MTDPLIASLDEGARKVLDMATAPERDAADRPNPTTLAERVKAFDSVVSWAETRLKLAPPKPTETKFDGIQRQFFGGPDSTKRRRNSGKGAQADGNEPLPAGDAATESDGNGGDSGVGEGSGAANGDAGGLFA